MTTIFYIKGKRALALTFFAVFFFLTSRADTEPNDAIGTANPINLGEEQFGDLGITPPADANDYYSISLEANGTLTVNASSDGSLGYRIFLYNNAGSLLSASPSGTEDLELVQGCMAPGTYFIRIFRQSSNGSYSFNTLFEESALANDVEPNGSIALANQNLFPGETITGQLGHTNGPSDNQDFFRLIFGTEGVLDLTNSVQGGLSSRLIAYRKNGGLIGSTGYSDVLNELTITCEAPDTLYVMVDRNAGCGSYSLSLELDASSYENDVEPNGSIATAAGPVFANSPLQGRLGYSTVQFSDIGDYHQLIVEENGNVTASVNFEESITGRLFLYYKNGGLIGSTGAGTGELSLTGNCLAADTVYALVSRNSGCGGYDFSFSVETPLESIDDEPNNSLAEAHDLIGVGEIQSGHLGHNRVGSGIDQSDHYLLNVAEDGEIHINLTSSGTLASRLFVYYSNGGQAAVSGISTDSVSLSVDCLAADTLFLRVSSNGGCGGYEVSFELETPQWSNDEEPNNSLQTADYLLEPGEVIEGHLGHYKPQSGIDQNDYYLINFNQNGNAFATANFEEGLTGRIYLYYSNGGLAGLSGIGTGEVNLDLSCFTADTLFALVQRTAGCGSYQFSFEIEEPSLAPDVEPNNSFAEAIEMNNGQQVTGHLGHYSPTSSTDQNDYYQLNVISAPFDMEVTAEFFGTLGGRLYLYNSNGGLISLSAISDESVSLNHTFEETGDYFIRVSATSGCGSYSLGDFCANHPDVEASALGATDFCPGDEVQLQGNDGLTYYQWLRNGSVVGSNQSLTASESGTYELVGSDENFCSSVSESIQVSIFEVPELTISASGPTEFCPGGMVEITASSGFSDYDWSTGESGVSIIVESSEEIDVGGTTADGCEAQSNSISVNVLDPGHPDCLDCPDLGGNIGDSCDDQDLNTVDDVITESCECIGTPISGCPGDFDNNLFVGTSDLLLLIGEYGCMSDCQTDLDGNEQVSSSDLLIFLSLFGTSCVDVN
ncbi:hypothetical protein [Halocola ammonii]